MDHNSQEKLKCLHVIYVLHILLPHTEAAGTHAPNPNCKLKKNNLHLPIVPSYLSAGRSTNKPALFREQRSYDLFMDGEKFSINPTSIMRVLSWFDLHRFYLYFDTRGFSTTKLETHYTLTCLYKTVNCQQ